MERTLSVVLASSNRGKLAEFAQLLAPHRVVVRSLSDFTDHGAEETGGTFLENAVLKARYAAHVSGLPAIADDSGLEVDALNGAPGIYSARFAGEGSTDAANNAKLLTALAGIPDAQRTARFRCVLVYVRNPDDVSPIVANGAWEGRVLTAPRGSGGFGYDPLFQPNESANGQQPLSAAELDPEIKNIRSHRGKALRELMQLLGKHGEIAT
jgi:XTP/dITP diphosphohydrolase